MFSVLDMGGVYSSSTGRQFSKTVVFLFVSNKLLVLVIYVLEYVVYLYTFVLFLLTLFYVPVTGMLASKIGCEKMKFDIE